MTVFTIAQPAGGTGKSTTAAQLLVALAEQGGEKRRVVGIDCDVSAARGPATTVEVLRPGPTATPTRPG